MLINLGLFRRGEKLEKSSLLSGCNQKANRKSNMTNYTVYLVKFVPNILFISIDRQ